jgi:hypothetical protein
VKSLTKVFALLVALNASAWILPQEASAQQVSVSFQLFYDELSPYGMWVDYPNYGYVWIPDGDPGFSPLLLLATGYLPMTAGRGFPTIPGDGQPSTMAAGITMMFTVGFGFLMMNGVLLGYRGEDLPVTTVGHLCDLASV